jgi:hypothetical protein
MFADQIHTTGRTEDSRISPVGATESLGKGASTGMRGILQRSRIQQRTSGLNKCPALGKRTFQRPSISEIKFLHPISQTSFWHPITTSVTFVALLLEMISPIDFLASDAY